MAVAAQNLDLTYKASLLNQIGNTPLIRLTKLDFNSCDFCSDFPITLARRQEIGDVLKALGRREPSPDPRYYV